MLKTLRNTFRLNGCLAARKIPKRREVIDYGIVSRQIITVSFLEHLIDAFQSDAHKIHTFKFHDSGIGTTPASENDTVLESKVEVDREIGTQEEGGEATSYKSVATITYTSPHEITEHGIFSEAVAGILLDHSVFPPISVFATDQIEFTYEFSVTGAAPALPNATLEKAERLEHYLKCLAPSLYAHGIHIVAQHPYLDVFNRQLINIAGKLAELEDRALASLCLDLYRSFYPRTRRVEEEEES